MKLKRTHKKNPAYLKYNKNRKLFRIIEGAVMDAMNQHPDYFTDQGRHSALTSITKRVCGAIIANPEKVPQRTVATPQV